MSYAYGTQLSYASGYECATVIGDDDVIITRSLGTTCRIPMKLSAWLEDAVNGVVEEFIPCPDDDNAEVYRYSEEETDTPIDSHNEIDTHAITDYSAHESHWLSSETFPVGTKLRWNCENGEGYRLAVVTKNGILQVKLSYPGPLENMSIEDNRKIFFESASDWHASLPRNGEVTVVPHISFIEKNTAFLSSPMSDVEKVKELMKVFKIRSYCLGGESPNDILDIFQRAMEKQHALLASRTLVQDIADPKARKDETNLLNVYVNRYDNYRRSTAMMPAEDFLKRAPISVLIRSPAQLSASVNRSWRPIMVYRGKIAVKGRQLADTFEDAGIDFIDGKPKLSLLYRKKMYNLF